MAKATDKERKLLLRARAGGDSHKGPTQDSRSLLIEHAHLVNMIAPSGPYQYVPHGFAVR
jgi:hypothetical protein